MVDTVRGRPRMDQSAPMEGFQVRLTAWHARMARRAGIQINAAGKESKVMGAGVRRAIEYWVENHNEDGTEK